MSERYDDDEPEPRGPIMTECIYCGGTFEVSDYSWVANYDCGGCRLDDEQARHYVSADYPPERGNTPNPEMAGRE